MMADQEQPFIIYRIYSRSFPISLFGFSPYEKTNADIRMHGSAVVISAGLHGKCGHNDNGVCAIPRGALGLDDIGRRFCSMVTSKFLDRDDSVVLIIDNFGSKSDQWTAKQNPSMEVFNKDDFYIIRTKGRMLSDHNWLQHVRPASETYVLAWHEAGSDFEEEIIDYAKRGIDPTIGIGKYWWAINNNPDDGQALLGQYKLFAYLGGFDLHDMIIQFKGIDDEIIRDSVKMSAKSIGIALYEGSTADQGGPFWIEGGTWRTIPNDWIRIL